MSAEVAAATAPGAPSPADPVAATTTPATTAAEATADPVRPTETEALTAESRPEVTGEAAVAAATSEPIKESDSAVPAATVAPTEEKVSKDEVKIEAEPISEGTLTYKAPGLLKNLIPKKQHFWFGDEPLSHETLTTYLKNEKDKAIAHHNVAHAAETGKGLLFFSKRHEDKSAPEGIINLGHAASLTRDIGNKFTFKINEKSYYFTAPTQAECERWIVSVETAIKDAASNKEVVINGEKYKLTKEKLAAPAAGVAAGAAVGAGAAAAASSSNKDKVHDGTAADTTSATATTTPKEEDKKEEKKSRSDSKGRSNSRKRQSIFGSLLGKKDDKAVDQANEKEAKKEEKAEEKKEEETAAAKPEVESSDKPAEAAAAVAATGAAGTAAVVAAEDKKAEEPTPIAAAPVEEKKTEEVKETKETPAPKNKRASVFGFFGKKSGDVPTTKDVAKEEVPAKETTTTDAAPQLDPVDTTTASEAALPAAETAGVTEGVAVAGPAAGSPEPHSNPLAPLEATPEAKAANKQKEGGDLFSFMKKKKAEHDDKASEDKTEGTAAAEKTEGTAASPTEKRRSSFFNSGLFRKASKSQKPTTGPVTDAGSPPAVPKTEEAAVEEAAKTETPVAASTDAAPAAEAAAKAEVPATLGGTTGTDGLPVTETLPAAAAPATTTTA